MGEIKREGKKLLCVGNKERGEKLLCVGNRDKVKIIKLGIKIK